MLNFRGCPADPDLHFTPVRNLDLSPVSPAILRRVGSAQRASENVCSIYGVANADPSPGKGKRLMPEPSALIGRNDLNVDWNLGMHRLSQRAKSSICTASE